MKLHHIGIQISDLKVTESFYHRYFGFKVIDYLELPGEKIAFLQRGNTCIELVETDSAFYANDKMHLCLEVDDLNQWIDLLAQKGLNPIEGPLMLQNGWKTVFYRGVDREVIELLERK
ncbi:lactoylglutathione lyase [Salirhabdus euzebyi]|uniref:Lactoylglutathione lyase n=1 Tax=Salirhabdus euzebyi TaxID=394506 RepID=A0A841Q637_9BACI|nr:VOC family protein [Salirhabdus euzebyi]MBB6453851.1 lactoylglutathione lyase [Salirhabdus euzebyi]